MDFSKNFTTKEEKDGFLKTRIDSLDLPYEINNLLLRNNILVVRGLVGRNSNYLKKELKLNKSQIEVISKKLSNLSLGVFQPDKTVEEPELINDKFRRAETASVESDVIINSLIKQFGIDESGLTGSSRRRDIVRMRDITIYFLRKYSGLSFPAIARLMGNRDHTTIIHSFRKIEKEQSLQKNFEIEFRDLIIQSNDALEERKRLEQTLPPHLIVKFKKIEVQKEIPERSLKVLEFFRQGITLEKIGKIINVTRERARQIIIGAIKQNALNETISTGVKIDFDTLFNQEKKTRQISSQKNKPTREKVRRIKEHKWSRYHDFCKSCGTNITPHFQRGLCDDCGNKSIYGEAREKMIMDHNNKCDSCGITREQNLNEYSRDFYLSRKMKSVLCRKCFLEVTGKKLSTIKRDKWKMFYK